MPRYASLKVSRRAGREPTRDAICAATEHLLAQIPFPELPVSAILEEADVSRRTFYLYFASKHAVLAALAATYMTDMCTKAGDWLERDDVSPEERLSNTMAGVVAIYQEHAHVLRAAADQWPYVPEIAETYHETMGWIIDQTAERIGRDREAGLTQTSADPHMLATGLMWTLERNLYLRSRDEPNTFPTDQSLADTMKAIWLGAIYQQAP